MSMLKIASYNDDVDLTTVLPRDWHFVSILQRGNLVNN